MLSAQLEAFIEYLTIIKGLSKASVEAYRNDLSLLETHYALPMISLDEVKLLDYLRQFENKRTLNRKLSSINAFYEFIHKEFEQERKVQKLKFSKIPSTLPKYLSYEQIMQALAQIDRSDWLGMRDYALILFLYASGTRISECLRSEHNDFEGLWLKIRHGKGDKERVVPLVQQAVDAIKAYESASPFSNTHVWLNYRGKPLSRISAYKITQKYLGVSPHVLRHSYATALIIGGADLRVVQELLGHASLLTTQVYTHIQRQNLQATLMDHHPLAN